MNSRPLAGINVIEIAGIGPGPCAGMMLADMGAEVILIERKAAAANAPGITPDNRQAFYNRGKKSIAVDLKQPQGIELVLRLIQNADALIEGFRPGVMERLGLGPDECLKYNPKLVYGRITGWGQSGPLAHAAGHDPNYVSLSGTLWYAARSDQAPVAPLTVLGDLGGGTMVLIWGMMCGLFHAQKTGQGQVIDAAITDGSAYLSSLLWMMYNAGQITDQPETGWADGAAPWNDTYECADGKYITVCALEPVFYQQLLERLGLFEHPLFSKQWDKTSWPEGKKVIKALFLSKTRKQWCELLEGSDVCFAPVLDFTEAALHPHNVARSTFLDIDGVKQPAPAPKLSLSQPQAGVVPRTGEHTDEILKAAGFDQNKINTLKDRDVI